MNPWLLIAVIVGLLFPPAVAVAIVYFAAPKGSHANWGLVFAFGKGIALGIIIGVTVCAVVICIVLGIAAMTGR
jgi:hypothetical protein